MSSLDGLSAPSTHGAGQGSTRPIAKAEGRTGRRLLALPRLTRVTAALQVLMVDGRRQPTAGVPFEHELIDQGQCFRRPNIPLLEELEVQGVHSDEPNATAGIHQDVLWTY